MHPTDPLAGVLELQKSTFPGFICDVTCNDLPTVMLLWIDKLTTWLSVRVRSGFDISAWPILRTCHKLLKHDARS